MTDEMTAHHRAEWIRQIESVIGETETAETIIRLAELNGLFDPVKAALQQPEAGEPVKLGFCIICANGNDLPDGERCPACDREGTASGLRAAVIKARGRPIPPSSPVEFTSPPASADMLEAYHRLLTTAKLLYAQCEGCCVNHHSIDFEQQGLPGWLLDCERDIKAAESLANARGPTSEGGVPFGGYGSAEAAIDAADANARSCKGFATAFERIRDGEQPASAIALEALCMPWDQSGMPSYPTPPDRETLWQHKKRGTVYRVLHDNAPIQEEQTEGRRLDDEPMVVYQDVNSCAVYVRPVVEFYDGRFLALTSKS